MCLITRFYGSTEWKVCGMYAIIMLHVEHTQVENFATDEVCWFHTLYVLYKLITPTNIHAHTPLRTLHKVVKQLWNPTLPLLSASLLRIPHKVYFYSTYHNSREVIIILRIWYCQIDMCIVEVIVISLPERWSLSANSMTLQWISVHVRENEGREVVLGTLLKLLVKDLWPLYMDSPKSWVAVFTTCLLLV